MVEVIWVCHDNGYVRLFGVNLGSFERLQFLWA